MTPERRDANRDDDPAHPTAKAIVLMIAVVLLVVALAALSAYGTI